MLVFICFGITRKKEVDISFVTNFEDIVSLQELICKVLLRQTCPLTLSSCLRYEGKRLKFVFVSLALYFTISGVKNMFYLFKIKLTLPNMDSSHGDILQPRNGMNYQMTLQ